MAESHEARRGSTKGESRPFDDESVSSKDSRNSEGSEITAGSVDGRSSSISSGSSRSVTSFQGASTTAAVVEGMKTRYKRLNSEFW